MRHSASLCRTWRPGRSTPGEDRAIVRERLVTGSRQLPEQIVATVTECDVDSLILEDERGT
jgi:hypothetical protein